jgi:hypothetical protein
MEEIDMILPTARDDEGPLWVKLRKIRADQDAAALAPTADISDDDAIVRHNQMRAATG